MPSRRRFLIIAIAALLVAIGFGMGVMATLFGGRTAAPSFGQLVAQFGGRSPTDTRVLERVWDAIHQDYLDANVNDQALMHGAAQGLVQALGDPYSVFLNPAASDEFQQEIEGSFDGLGMEVGIKDERLTVIAPLPDTPADRAGIRSGDVILRIGDQDAQTLSLTQAVQALRGPRGTHIKLEVERQSERLQFDLQRDTIRLESVVSRVETRNQRKIGYFQISHFTRDTDQLFQRAGRELLDQHIVGLVLDLRNNPGGLLDQSIQVAGALVADQVVVREVDRQGREQERRASGTAWLGDLPVVVLINEGSASAAEIVAGALQDHQRAQLVGQTTFGKGTVQDYQILPDGSSLKLTIAKWLTPKGRSINDHGIQPDIAVEQPESEETDAQLERALELLSAP